jgi:AraC-like DNA-binding protein
MDEFAGLLDGPRAQDAFLLRCSMEPPWSLRIQDRAPVSLFALTEGEAWFVPDDGEPVHLLPGDLALARGPEPYTVADAPDRAPMYVVHPDQHCTTVGGASLVQSMAFGVRSWGNAAGGSTTMLVGTYERCGEMSQRLLDALPSHLVLRDDEAAAPLTALLGTEIGRDAPGQQVVLDRLLDLLLVTALRSWFSKPEAEAPAWFGAQHDPVVGPAVRLLHDHPSEPWTVASLASTVGVSRAALARRFHGVVGEPPMRYLARWRLALAADLLCEPHATVTGVAHQVGYGSPFALSSAFKREHGLSPTEHRAKALSERSPAA